MKILKKIMALLMTATLTITVCATVYAEDNTENSAPVLTTVGDTCTVSGITASRLKRTVVTFLVIAPGKDLTDVSAFNTSGAIYDLRQISAGIGGRYEYKFNMDSYGEYKIYINEDTTRAENPEVNRGKLLTAYKYKEPTGEISSDKMGHIYFNGDKASFNLKVTATPNMQSDISVTAKVIRLNEDAAGVNQEGATVAEKDFNCKTDLTGRETIDLDFTNELADKFGIFKISAQIKDTAADKTATVSTRFSRVNTARNTDGMNYRMGVAQHLQNGWDVTDDLGRHGYFGAGKPIDDRVPGGADADKYYDLFAYAGYNMQREEIHWSIFDKGRVETAADGTVTNKYNGYGFRSDQEMYLKLQQKKGIKPLVIMGLENSKYLTKDQDGNYIRPYNNSKYAEAYEKYCYNLVKATADYTDRYEIMNEYNIGFNRFLEKDDKGIYSYKEEDFIEHVQLMKAAYTGAHRAAKELGKDITVYGIASAQILNYYDAYGVYTFKDGTKSQYAGNKTYEWIDGILRNGGGNYMDELSFHVYTNGYIPESYKGDKVALVNDLNKLLEQNNCKKPLFISETGYSTDVSTETEQAKYELRDWARLYNKITGISWYNAIEKPNSDNYEHSLGHIKMHDSYTWNKEESSGTYAVDIPYEAKRVYLAMANWNTLLANSELKKENVNESNNDYVFNTTDNRTVHMLWNSENNEATVNVNADASKAVVYDMYGNPKEVTAENGMYTVKISGEPVYLEETKVRVTFEDANGNAVLGLSSGINELYAEVDFEQNIWDELNGSGTVILAAYGADGRLLDCSVKTISQISTDKKTNVSVTDAEEVRLYIFDSTTNLKPVTGYFNINK